MSCAAMLVVPGDLQAQTGGYLYDRRLLAALNELGHDVRHLALPGSFPNPSARDLKQSADLLASTPAGCPLIIDGLALGVMTPDLLASVHVPVIALVHHPLAEETGIEAARRKSLHASEREVLKVVAHIIVTSPHTAEVLTSRYDVEPHRITVARPGVEPVIPRPKPADPPLILSVGIGVARKGHDVLLNALARIADREWQAVIVGEARDPDYAQTLQQLVASLELTQRVRLAGRVAAGELTQLFREASLFALATRYEGYGIVFAEAMCNGLPIVSCAVGAVPDTVAPGAGQLVPVDNPEAFAGAMETLLGDETKRSAMASASLAAGQRLPRWTDTAETVADVIERVTRSD